MENLNQNIPPQSPPQPPIFQPPHSSRKPILIGFLIFIFLIGGYSVLAKYRSLWPFKLTEMKESSLDTTEWQKYTNSDYGFGLNYPTDWKYEDLADADEGAGIDTPENDSSILRLDFRAPAIPNQKNGRVIVEVVPPNSEFSKPSLQEFINYLETSRGEQIQINNQQKISVGDAEEAISADEFYDGSTVYNIVLIKKSGYIYVLSLPQPTPKTKIYFDKILSTLILTQPEIRTEQATDKNPPVFIYTNTAFNYQISPSRNWWLQEGTEKSPLIKLSLMLSDNKVLVVIQASKIPFGTSPENPTSGTSQPVKIAGYDAMKTGGLNQSTYMYYLVHDTTGMWIEVTDQNMSYTSEVDQLLSTLKFTN